jgi:hypothetical protein
MNPSSARLLLPACLVDGWYDGFGFDSFLRPSDVPSVCGRGRQLLYDILNDSHDVTERKTGSLFCRLAMADSKFPFGTFVSFMFHSCKQASGTTRRQVSLAFF